MPDRYRLARGRRSGAQAHAVASLSRRPKFASFQGVDDIFAARRVRFQLWRLFLVSPEKRRALNRRLGQPPPRLPHREIPTAANGWTWSNLANPSALRYGFGKVGAWLEDGQEIQIIKHGKPVARFLPPAPSGFTGQRRPPHQTRHKNWIIGREHTGWRSAVNYTIVEQLSAARRASYDFRAAARRGGHKENNGREAPQP